MSKTLRHEPQEQISGVNTKPPTCIALLVCNEVIEDKFTGNKTIVGIFNTIRVQALPYIYHRFFIFASIGEGAGEWPCSVQLLAPSGKTLIQMEGKVAFNHPEHIADLVVEIRGLLLEETGAHTVEILIGKTLLTKRKFQVLL